MKRQRKRVVLVSSLFVYVEQICITTVLRVIHVVSCLSSFPTFEFHKPLQINSGPLFAWVASYMQTA